MERLGYNPIDEDDEEDNFYTSSEDVSEDEGLSESNTTKEEVSPSLSISFEDDDDDVGDTNSSNSNNDLLSQEERMRYFSDKVISAIVGGKKIGNYAINKLVASTSPKLFRDENYIIFSILYSYRDRIRKVNIDSEFVSLFLDNNRKMIEKATGYIDIHAYGEIDGSATLGYISGVVKHFNRLCGMPDMTEAEFDLNFEKYTIVFKAIEAQKVYANSNQILTDGMKIGGKRLVGFEDSYNYSRRSLAEIEGLVDMNQGTGFTSMRDVIMSEKNEGKKPMKIADFDKLESLTKYIGGVYTGNFYQVMAPPKAGKSKFCARLCHTAVVKYGHNVTVWAQEGGNEAWSAQMRAIHFDYTFNDGASVTERKTGIDQDVILMDKFASQELRDLEMTSKIDLVSNTEYGNVDLIDRPFLVETFIEEIDTSVKANNSKLVVIDYLQLIGSQSSRLSKTDCIAKAYPLLLNYCKKNNVAVITPCQYKQEVLNALASKSETADAEMRAAGGGSAETVRTPDYNFAFWASTADLRNNRMKVLSMPGRFNKPFPEISCYIDLSVCQFVSLDND